MIHLILGLFLLVWSGVAQAIPVAVAALAATTVTAVAIEFSVATFVTVLALEYVAQGMLAPQDTPAPMQDVKGRQEIVRSSTENRRIVYGKCVTSGPLIYAGTSGDLARYYYSEDFTAQPGSYQYTIKDTDLTGFVDGGVGFTEYIWDPDNSDGYRKRYHSLPKDAYTNGATPNPAFGHYQVDTSTGTYYFNHDWCNDISQELHIGYSTTSDKSGNTWLHLVVPVSGAEIDSIVGMYVGPDYIDGSFFSLPNITGTKYAGHVFFQYTKGQPTYWSDLGAACPDWTSGHDCQGFSATYTKLNWTNDLFPSGIPNLKFVVKGKPVWDPRNSNDASVKAWNDNWALCILDYLMDTDFGMGIPQNEIDVNSFIAAANISDENVIRPDGTTGPRYRVNGTVNCGDAPMQIMKDLLAAGAGTLVFTQGVYKLYAGAYNSATWNLSEKDLRGEVVVSPTIPRKDLYNSVTGTYLEPSKDWQPTNFPEVTDSAYVTQDGGELIQLDLSLPYTTDVMMAQRLAKIYLKKARYGQTVQIPCKMTAFGIAIWDTINLSIKELGWTNQIFRVVDWKFDPSGGGVDLVLRQEAPDTYDWAQTDGTQPTYTSPSDLPDGYTVSAPTGFQFAAGIFQGLGEALLSWANTDAMSEYFQVEYQANGDSDWSQLPRTTDTKYTVTGLQTGYWNFRVKAISGMGVSSPYATVSGWIDVTAVPNVTGLELHNASLGTEFTDLDAKFVWREGTWTNQTEFSSAAPATTGTQDNYFRDYEIRIYDKDGNQLRVEHTTDPSYTYTYEKNKQDGNGAANRAFTIKVWQRGQYNQISAYPASLDVSNPAPSIQGVSTTVDAFSCNIFYTPSTEADVVAAKIWVSKTSGYTPDDTTLVYTGPSNPVNIKLQSNTTYYIRAALVDKFGSDNIVYSPEIQVKTLQVVNQDIAVNSIDISKLLSGLTLVEIVSALPTSGNYIGRTVFLNTDSKLYRYNGSTFVSSVPTVDLTGQISASQIAANTITADQIAANTITAGQIAAGAITASQIAASTITGSQIAAGTINANNIAANTITASQIAAGTITADRIAANTITAGQIAAGTITASQIASATITGSLIAAGTITASNIAANTITASQIAAGTITATEIAANTITAAKMSVTDLSAISANLGSISVDTLHIAGNAVTFPNSVNTTSYNNVSVPAVGFQSYYVVVQEMQVSCSGQPVIVSAFLQAYNTLSSNSQVGVYIGRAAPGSVPAIGTQISGSLPGPWQDGSSISMGGYGYAGFAVSVLDTGATSGNWVYYIAIGNNPSAATLNLANISINTVETKR